MKYSAAHPDNFLMVNTIEKGASPPAMAFKRPRRPVLMGSLGGPVSAKNVHGLVNKVAKWGPCLAQGEGLNLDVGVAFSAKTFTVGATSLAAAAGEALQKHPVIAGSREFYTPKQGIFGDIGSQVSLTMELGGGFSILGASVTRALHGPDLAYDIGNASKISGFLDFAAGDPAAKGFILVYCVNCDPGVTGANDASKAVEDQIFSAFFKVIQKGHELLAKNVVLALEAPFSAGGPFNVDRSAKLAALSRSFIASYLPEKTANDLRIILCGALDAKAAGEALNSPELDGLLLTNLADDPDVFFSALHRMTGARPEDFAPPKKGARKPIEVEEKKCEKMTSYDRYNAFMAAVREKTVAGFLAGLKDDELIDLFDGTVVKGRGTAALFHGLSKQRRAGLLTSFEDRRLAMLFSALAECSWLGLVDESVLSDAQRQKMEAVVAYLRDHRPDVFQENRAQFDSLIARLRA